jgi:hypothetical protein
VARSTTLAIRIVSDASGAAKGFDAAEKKVAGFSRGLDKASSAAAGILGGIGLVAKEAFDAASALQQSGGAVESVFGKQAAAVKAYAKAASRAVGLSTNSYNELASVIGSQLKNMGVAHDDLVPKTDQLIRMGADLAATFGGTAAEAVGALSSLLRGETDPIERYGVSIKAADINARLAAEGLDHLEGPALKAAQSQALLGMVTEQTASATGAFARESDTAAGAQQRAAAEFENAKAALGEVLLPIVAEAMNKFSELTTKLVENKDTVIPLIKVVGGLAFAVLAVNGAVKAYRAALIIAAGAQALFNFVVSANPLGLLILAIAAVIGAVILLINKFGGFKNFMAGLKYWLGSVFDPIIDKVKWLLDKLSFVKSAAKTVVGWFAAPTTAEGAAPATVGMYGATAAPPAPIRGAAMGSLTGGPSPSAGQGPGGGTVVNVTVNGALDPVAVGRQIEQVLSKYQQSTGRRSTVALGRA